MSIYINKKDGRVDSVHLHGDALRELVNIVDQLWCDFAHKEIKDKYATQWPHGYAAIKELMKELY